MTSSPVARVTSKMARSSPWSDRWLALALTRSLSEEPVAFIQARMRDVAGEVQRLRAGGSGKVELGQDPAHRRHGERLRMPTFPRSTDVE